MGGIYWGGARTGKRQGKMGVRYWRLVGLVFEDDPDGAEEDFDVEPDRPFADVPVIERDARFHFFDGIGFAAATLYLR